LDFDQNVDFWSYFLFLTKILIFDQHFDFWPIFRFLTKISIFDQYFDFWPKFRFLTKISIFDQNFDFWPKFRFFTKISIFVQNFNISPNFDQIYYQFNLNWQRVLFSSFSANELSGPLIGWKLIFDFSAYFFKSCIKVSCFRINVILFNVSVIQRKTPALDQ